MDTNLLIYIKYCLGYVKLTRRRTFAAQHKFSAFLTKGYFNLVGLLNGDIDGSLGETVNLKIFYTLDPKELTQEQREQYQKQKNLADKIEDIYNKYRNDQFRKQIVFNFGYFEIEIPIEVDENGIEMEQANLLDEEDNITPSKITKYPLFSFPIKIEKESDRYVVYPVDIEIQVNISVLESILGQDLYYQLVEEIAKHEIEGDLTPPLTKEKIFYDIWHTIKEKLKHTNANFDEGSFKLDEMSFALSSQVNYFLAEDLQKLSKLEDEDLKGTSLSSWVDDDELTIESDMPKENDLYFPFLYDKYQLRVLSIINNRASIVQGPPGTGKSETIANILCHLAATGKKVLFVSQKAQALKVVKDKLKNLKVKYLFGYIPNPRSAQLDLEDEIDGIAPQLAALDSYVEKMGYKYHSRQKVIQYPNVPSVNSKDSLKSNIHSKIIEKSKLKISSLSYFETQRNAYRLQEELVDLKDYNIDISNTSNFKKNIDFLMFKEIGKIKGDVDGLSKAISLYEKNRHRDEYNKLFSGLDFTNSRICEAICKIKDDIVNTAYDRHSKILRRINNYFRNLRLNKSRSQLPREIIDCIDSILNRDLPRSEIKSKIAIVCDYCVYRYNLVRLSQRNKDLNNKLSNCGITHAEYRKIKNLLSSIDAHRFEETKNRIIRVQEIKKELKVLRRQCVAINETPSQLKDLRKSHSECIAQYLQNIINSCILSQCKNIKVRQITKKLGKAFGKSKKAFKTFDKLRRDPSNFDAILDLIPIWIMELDDASRIIPLESAIFDYVILDEASQCNIAYTMPVMYRAKHALFVGDSEQMRDSTIIFKSNRAFDELARRYKIPDELQIKATGASVQSVLDIATLRGVLSMPLRYHYRSPNELIGFSNEYFYKPKGKELITINSNYLTYKDTNRIMSNHHVRSDWNDEFSDKVNIAEAQQILQLFKELRVDKRYEDKSIGILSFFNAQATFIRELFEKEGYKEEDDNYKISIIEGIQGDEKDIVIYSFVIRSSEQKNKYVPLTGEGGDIRADINKGRVNVAFSRARLQTHCFVSLPIQEIPERIWIKKYLKYVEEKGKIDFYTTGLKPFDSKFEEDFYHRICKKLFKKTCKVQNQVKSCGFKIDFVVTNTSNAKTLAIECDGPTHFADELDEECGIYIEDDLEREEILRAAGWDFYRIKYSDWIDQKFDKEAILKDITLLLG